MFSIYHLFQEAKNTHHVNHVNHVKWYFGSLVQLSVNAGFKGSTGFWANERMIIRWSFRLVGSEFLAVTRKKCRFAGFWTLLFLPLLMLLFGKESPGQDTALLLSVSHFNGSYLHGIDLFQGFVDEVQV